MVPHDKRGCGLRSSAAPWECQLCEVCAGEWLREEGFLELAIAALPADEDLSFVNVPDHKSGDPGVAAKDRITGPDWCGKRLGQLPLPDRPASEHALIAVLERDRADAAPTAASAREANEGGSGLPPLKLLPHLAVGNQLMASAVKPGSMRPGSLAARGRPADLARVRLARGAWTLPPSPSAVQDGAGLIAVPEGLAA